MKNSRRRFLRSAAIGAGLAGITVTSCTPDQKENDSSQNPMFDEGYVVGQNGFTYKVNKGWGTQNPIKIPVKDCHEMVQDSKGRLLLLTNHTKNNIIIYDQSGKVLETWGNDWPGAHGLSLHDEGGEEFLYVTDQELNQVFKTTLNGEVLLTLDYPQEVKAYEKKTDFIPTETCISPNGDIYVADGYGKSIITQFSPKGEYIRHFGGLGNGQNQFDCPHGITIDYRSGEPCLLITSRSKQEFKRFTLDGKHIETISTPGCFICRPVIKGDYLYFAVLATKTWWGYDGMVAVFDKDYKAISFPGGTAPNYVDGQLQKPDYDKRTFMNPHDVCIDNDENIYVSQWYSGNTYPIKLERV